MPSFRRIARKLWPVEVEQTQILNKVIKTWISEVRPGDPCLEKNHNFWSGSLKTCIEVAKECIWLMESVSTKVPAPPHFRPANPALPKYSGGNGKSVSFSMGNQKRARLSVRRLLFWEINQVEEMLKHFTLITKCYVKMMLFGVQCT